MKSKTHALLPLIAAMSALLATNPSLRAADTDSRIESSAQKSYVFKTYLKDDAIKIASKNGIVTLTGTIAEPSHKTLAQDTVENLPGVTRVDNLLVVSGEQPAPHSDGWIGTKVKSALFFHRYVSCTGTTVSVTNGVVTLGGEAASLAQKELTAEYAKDVENVVSVNNNMTVAAAPPAPDSTAAEKIDDASITAQVKASLLARHSTSAIKTKVQTADGVVTISGTAKNAAEIALVTKLATDIQGVASVINNMTIEVVAANPK